MRNPLPAAAVALALPFAPISIAAAFAQGTGQDSGNSRALDSLTPSHAARKPASHRAHVGRHAHPMHGQAAQAPARKVATTTPPIPPAPPPPPVFTAPVIDVPLHPEPPPPPVPVLAHAAGTASSIGELSRITFGAGSADLNADTMAALQKFAQGLGADPQARAEIDAYAAGTPDDPSTPRRTSLSRGLAARAVLINAGIASTRIYVRAIGQPHDSGPADRVDLTHPEGPPIAAPTNAGTSAAASASASQPSSKTASPAPGSPGNAGTPP